MVRRTKTDLYKRKIRKILTKLTRYCILTNRELRLLKKSKLIRTLLHRKYTSVKICGTTFLVKKRFNCRDIGPILTILPEELAKRHILESTPNIELCHEVECLYETILREEANTRDIVLALLRLIPQSEITAEVL